jgi:hypothetical protein
MQDQSAQDLFEANTSPALERRGTPRLTLVPTAPERPGAIVRARPASAALMSLLPAVKVAWADGEIQEEERDLILALAEREGIADRVEEMGRVVAWLESPPSNEEVGELIGEMRRLFAQDGTLRDGRRAGEIVEWARSVARSHGGMLGFRSISDAEARTLEWLESVLDPGRVSQNPSEPPAAQQPGTLDILRALLLERAEGVTDHVDHVPEDVESMWPRQCPRHGDAMPPAVFGIPQDEYREYMSVIVSRYLRTLTNGTWRGIQIAANYEIRHVTDDEVSSIAWETPISRLISTTLDPRDEKLFARVLPTLEDADAIYKIDHSHIANMMSLPGIYIAPTVALFARRGDQLTVAAIAVRNKAFTPRDGESWARSKSFFLQGCAMSLVGGVHAGLHFPADSVIAVTREALPESHPIRRLVEAHAYLQLPLNYGVRWNPRSVAWNDQSEVYTPFPTPGSSVFQGFSDHYAGMEDNSGFPGYRYPMEAPSFPGPYAAFLRAYYDVILSFCRRVADHVDRTDPDYVCWAAGLADLLPGFPTVEALTDAEVLARALTGFVHGVSVWHSVEHHLFGEIPLHCVPHRLRVPPPTGNDPVVPVERWMTRTDLFRQEMARHMFYEAHSVRTILEVDYGFETPELREAAVELEANLRACDEAQPRRFIPLERIACSIQF